jgi:hypothetical protein
MKLLTLGWDGVAAGAAEERRMVDSLMKEVEVLAGLDKHPNIVHYLGIHREGDALNIYLEYVSGEWHQAGELACWNRERLVMLSDA